MAEDNESSLQARIDELEKRNKELEEQLAGNIPQVSSAQLHNYPDAAYQPASKDEEPKSEQPLTGTAATSKEH
jgi:hypothetical protein